MSTLRVHLSPLSPLPLHWDGLPWHQCILGLVLAALWPPSLPSTLRLCWLCEYGAVDTGPGLSPTQLDLCQMGGLLCMGTSRWQGPGVPLDT